MDGLIEFLRARLDEDEAAAHAAYGVMWQGVGGWLISEDMHIAEVDDGSTLAHIACHDPARVLREIEAKRRLLDAYAEVADMDTDDPEPEFAYGRAAGFGEAVRLLAAPYGDHPEYRREWAP